MLTYEPLKELSILMVATVAAVMWALRDTMATAVAWRPRVKERLTQGYMKVRGIEPYEGRHRLA